jgi:predicted transcriptional regulator
MNIITTNIDAVTARKLSKIARKKNVTKAELFLEAINELIHESTVSEKVVKELKSSQRRMKRGSATTHGDFWKALNV